MTRFVTSNFVPATLALLLVMVMALSGEQIRKWWGASTPAIDWQGVEVLTKTVHPGGVLTLVYTATINKQCPADLRGFLVDAQGNTPVRFPVVAGGQTKPTEAPVKIRVSITVPPSPDAGLAPYRSGPHIYRTSSTRYCPDGIEEDDRIPDAPFTLEVP